MMDGRGGVSVSFAWAVVLTIASCANQPLTTSEAVSNSANGQSSTATVAPTANDAFAIVTAVEAIPQEANQYTLSVTIESPDTGCDQYANWWEVLTPEGELLYRRILAHSHVDEQPFARSGGPVSLQPEQTVIVRAHMQPYGYGSQAMQGTVSEGFEAIEVPAAFAAPLANADPQPEACAF